MALVKEAKLPAVINRAFMWKTENGAQSELTGKLVSAERLKWWRQSVRHAVKCSAACSFPRWLLQRSHGWIA